MLNPTIRVLLLACSAGGLLGACAAPNAAPGSAEPVATTAKLDCNTEEPTTGSKLVRRSNCVARAERTPEEIEATRRLTEEMRRNNQVMQIQAIRPPGSGG